MSAATGRRISRTTPLVIVAIGALALVLLAVLWHGTSDHGGTGAFSATRADYGSAGVETVQLEGFNGRLTVGVGDAGQIVATAQPFDGREPPTQKFTFDSATHTLTLACFAPGTAAGAVPCPATDYSVFVPAHVGVVLRELSGQATLTGLSGPVSITASSADTTAQGLRTSDFTATITSGTLDASFDSPPAKVAVSVTSAQASLHLPGSVAYAVVRHTVSADIQVALPVSAASPHAVQATATSGEINLLTT